MEGVVEYVISRTLELLRCFTGLSQTRKNGILLKSLSSKRVVKSPQNAMTSKPSPLMVLRAKGSKNIPSSSQRAIYRVIFRSSALETAIVIFSPALEPDDACRLELIVRHTATEASHSKKFGMAM